MKKLSATFAGLAMLLMLAQMASSESLANRKGFLAFQPRAGYVLPTGSYRNVSSHGLGLQGSVEYYVTDRLALGATIGYVSSKASVQAINSQEAALSSPAARPLARPAPVGETGNVTSATVNPVTISSWKRQSLQYGVFTRYSIPLSSPLFSPYVSAGLGLYNTGGSVSGTGMTQQQLDQATGSNSKTSFGVNIGSGLLLNLTPAIGFVAGVSYHDAFSHPATNYFQINTGLNFFVNAGR